MSTKQTSTGNNSTAFQFDPGSMNAYHQNLNTFLPFLRNNVTNPFGSDAFQQESVQSQNNAANIGQRMKSNIVNNAAALGYGTNGGLFTSMINRAGRDTSGLQAQGFRNAINNAVGRQMQSTGMLSAFQPLMTGSNGTFQNTQTTSGLGTWLPQMIGAGAGLAMNAFMPGASATGGLGGMSRTAATGAPVSVPSWQSVMRTAGSPGMPNIGGWFPGIAPQSSFGYGAI